MAGHPGTIYGVYKRANESTAAVYFAENGISSTGLRPHTVYGVGRDQGVTSAPTTAMLAAAAGHDVHDPVRRRARSSSSRATSRARSSPRASRARRARPSTTCRGAASRSRRSSPRIGADSIGFDDVRLPFPEEVDSASFTAGFPDFAETPLADGVAATVDRFRALLAEGLVQPPRARSLMSNSSFRDDWQAAVRPRRARRSSASASTTPTTPASRRWSRRRRRSCSASSRTRSAATATRSCCRPASATSTPRPSWRS